MSRKQNKFETEMANRDSLKKWWKDNMKFRTAFQGFFSKFLMGGDSKFSVPDGTKSDGGDLRKNLTEAKTAHLMQN